MFVQVGLLEMKLQSQFSDIERRCVSPKSTRLVLHAVWHSTTLVSHASIF